jgi:GNAT superfamily N-acetyltransferase
LDIHEFYARPYQLGDEERIVDLLQLGFNRWPYFDVPCSPLEHWRWRYVDNPFKRNLVVVAETNDMIVGVNHTYFINTKIGNNLLFCSYGGDVVVHPDFRGKHITTLLMDKKKELLQTADVQYNYATTTNPLVVKMMNKWKRPQFPFSIVDLVKIDDVGLHLRMNPRDDAWLLNVGYKVASLVGNIQSRIDVQPKRKIDYKIQKIDKFYSEISQFWKQVSDHYLFITDRSLPFLNWQFCDPRAGNYVVIQAIQDASVLGYITLRINRQKPDYFFGHIADLLTLPERTDVAEKLIETALHHFNEANVNIIECKFVRGHPFESILRRFGFVDSRKETHTFYIPLVEDEIQNLKVNSPDKLQFTYSDM